MREPMTDISREIAKDIKAHFGSAYINGRQAGEYLGMQRDKRCQFLADVPCYPTGKEKKYFVNDLARHMAKLRTYAPYG